MVTANVWPHLTWPGPFTLTPRLGLQLALHSHHMNTWNAQECTKMLENKAWSGSVDLEIRLLQWPTHTLDITHGQHPTYTLDGTERTHVYYLR